MTEPSPTTQSSAETTNPLLEAWAGPFGGLPPFDRVGIADFKPALEKGMAMMASEIHEIVAMADPPTFANTVEPLERAGKTLDRVSAIYRVWAANRTSPDFQRVEREMEPRLTAHWDRIRQNEALFRRVEGVYESAEMATLTEEQQRLVWRYYINHLHAGAKLDGEAKRRVAEINERLATLFTEFNANVLADEGGQVLVLDEEDQLAGLPASIRDAAAAASEAAGEPGKWRIVNTRSSVDPFLTYADRRDLRERAWKMFVGRGDLGGEHDNKAIIVEILALRGERAKRLGYPTHAHIRLETAMAKTPEAAMELMKAVWVAALERVEEEVEDMQKIIEGEGESFPIAPWDYRYYAEKVRQRRYEIDQDDVMKYLRLDRLRDAMFWVAGELYGFAFRPLSNVPTFHPDVRVWDVFQRADGRHLGLFYFDPFARAGKRSGAWMTSYRAQERFDGEVATLVSNNSNFVESKPGELVLISWTDAVTLFHEFGHAVHGLASSVQYPSLSGTAYERDYVEFPSQLMEHWLSTPEVLGRFALHHETGEPMPQELVDRIERAATFNQGFATVEYLIDALVDMELHLAPDTLFDPATYEREALERFDMPPQIGMRHRLPHFSHIFSSDSYSAGYYGYLWADVLAADAYEAFLEASGPFDRTVAHSLYENVLTKGSSLEPSEGWRRFRGRDPEVGALMRKRGLD